MGWICSWECPARCPKRVLRVSGKSIGPGPCSADNSKSKSTPFAAKLRSSDKFSLQSRLAQSLPRSTPFPGLPQSARPVSTRAHLATCQGPTQFGHQVLCCVDVCLKLPGDNLNHIRLSNGVLPHGIKMFFPLIKDRCPPIAILNIRSALAMLKAGPFGSLRNQE